MSTYLPEYQKAENAEFANQWRQAVLGDKKARKALLDNIVNH